MLWAVTHSRKILQFNILQTIQTDIIAISDNPDVLEPMQVVEKMERETGIEPATNSLEGCDSTIELLPLR